MAIIFGITAFLFFVVLPIFTIALLIKPRLLKRYLKTKKPHRGKIFATTSATAIVLFIIMCITVPPVSPEQKAAEANTATIKQQQQIEANKTKLADQQSKSIAEASSKIDKENAKNASKLDIHNSSIEIGNDKQYTYKIVSNSNAYDIRVMLLDKDKVKVDAVDLNHANNNWFIKSKYSPDKVKFITYSVSVSSKYYDSKKILSLSNDVKDYPGMANSIKVQNTQIFKDENKYSYLFSASSRQYDLKVDLYNDKNEIIYTKDIKHDNPVFGIGYIDLKPVSMGGTVAYIKTRISIDTKLYDSSNKVAFSSVFDDKDAARVIAQQKADAAAEAARQQAASEEAAKQAAAAAATAAQSQQSSSSNVYYANCTAARAAGVTPIYSGQPGYRSSLDRDNDGIACE